VKLEQCCRLDQRAKLRNPARIHEQRGQSKHEAIERGQIRCALPRSIADQKLMFEQKRLCGDATGAEQLCAGDQQVDGEDEVPSLPVHSRLHGAGELGHTTNSPPTGQSLRRLRARTWQVQTSSWPCSALVIDNRWFCSPL
jgi:hypothetical protein